MPTNNFYNVMRKEAGGYLGSMTPQQRAALGHKIWSVAYQPPVISGLQAQRNSPQGRQQQRARLITEINGGPHVIGAGAGYYMNRNQQQRRPSASPANTQPTRTTTLQQLPGAVWNQYKQLHTAPVNAAMRVGRQVANGIRNWWNNRPLPQPGRGVMDALPDYPKFHLNVAGTAPRGTYQR